jgi:hypothetical protein
MANFNLNGPVSSSDNSPTAVMQTPAVSSGGSAMSFPGDIQNMPYYTSLRFVKYSRPFAGSSATEQTTGTVILPVPEGMVDVNDLRYNGMNYGIVGAMGAAIGAAIGGSGDLNEAKKVGQDLATAYQNAQGGADYARIAAVVGLAAVPGGMQDSKIAGIVQGSLGVVQNPHLALLFDGVNLRPHSLSWKLSPKSESEAKSLGTLLTFMKKASLPSYNQIVSKFALDYPNQVIVDFVGVDKQFKDSIKKSMVTNIAVDIANDAPAFFKGGRPVEIRVRLELTEVEIRTAEDYGS